MRIVSLVGAATVAVMMTLVGCGNGPGGTKPAEPAEAPTKQAFTGTFTVAPDTTNPLMGTITVTITDITHDGEALAGPAVKGILADLGAEQEFSYTLSEDMTMITVTGALLEKLMLPGGMVTATRSGTPEMERTKAGARYAYVRHDQVVDLYGTWTADVEDPQTKATTTLTLEIVAPDRFTLTVDTTPRTVDTTPISDPGTFAVFGLNIRNTPFDDVKVRHALQMALDLEAINGVYYRGRADWKDPRFNGVSGYYTPFEEWPAELKGYYTYDPAGAEKLLDEAGYLRGADGVRFRVDYAHRDGIDLGYTEIAAHYWAEIGVEVTIHVLDTAAWVAARAGHTYEMITGGMAFTNPRFSMTVHRHEDLHVREYLGGVDTSVLDVASDAFFAATTLEEQLEASKAYDMEVMRQHNQIWGPLVPRP